MLTKSLRSSLSALGWSILLLCTMQTFIAMLIRFLLEIFYLGQDSPLSASQKFQLFEYFGTYTRTMVSLFEITMANWTPICRFLMEELHEAFMVPVVLYRLVMGLAVIGVINAVFMQETFKVVN